MKERIEMRHNNKCVTKELTLKHELQVCPYAGCVMEYAEDAEVCIDEMRYLIRKKKTLPYSDNIVISSIDLLELVYKMENTIRGIMQCMTPCNKKEEKSYEK